MNTNTLSSCNCFLLDLDGTLYLDDQLLPGAIELLDFFESQHMTYRFITNNSSKSKSTYLRKLTSLGLPATMENIITSGQVSIAYLKEHFPSQRMFIVGTDELIGEFSQAGFSIDPDNPEILVLGFDTTLTYEKIRKLCHWVSEGLPFIATHSDINCPTSSGFIPDIGSFLAMVSTSTGRHPDVIIGKPFQPLIDYLKLDTGLAPEKMAMIGDRLYTDMAMSRHGIFTILVLTGETQSSELLHVAEKPNLVVENLPQLLKILEDK